MLKRNHLGADRVVRPELPRLFATLNMAPFSCILMVQVVLISLSFGLLTQSGLDVSLPSVAPASLDAYTMQVVVEITADGAIVVNNTPIAIETLESRLRGIVAGRQDKTVFVIGAGSLRYGDVVPLIDAARGACARVGIVTERMLETSQRCSRASTPRKGVDVRFATQDNCQSDHWIDNSWRRSFQQPDTPGRRSPTQAAREHTDFKRWHDLRR